MPTSTRSPPAAPTRLLEADNVQSRFDAVIQSDLRDEGRGVDYHVQYCLRPEPGAETKLWIEDTGRWFAGPTASRRAPTGSVRVINERHEREQQLNYLARFDGLTGELNRDHLTEVLGSHHRGGDALSLVLRLSAGRPSISSARINEAYGFDVADEVIAAVAKRIARRCAARTISAACPATSSASC